jgi:hypothetical protein
MTTPKVTFTYAPPNEPARALSKVTQALSKITFATTQTNSKIGDLAGAIRKLGGSITFAVIASSPPFRELIEYERRRTEELNRQLFDAFIAEQDCYCDHVGRTMTRREHARMHAAERKRAR